MSRHNTENQWVDKDDVFADEAVREFKQSNPTSETHIRTIKEPYVLTIPTPVKYMSSPTPSTIENAVLSSYTTNSTQEADHKEFCRALTTFVGPIPGRVSPDFLDEQRDGSTEDEENAEVVQDVKDRADRQGASAPQLAVRIPSTSDLSAILCSHSQDPTYCEDCAIFGGSTTKGPNPVFVWPPGTPRHPLGSLDGVSPTCTQGEKPVGGDVVSPSGRIRGYLVDETDDEENANKENNQDATRVSRVRQTAEGMEDRSGRGRGRRGSVAEAEVGPIQLYHPWQTHSISVQAKRSESPVPRRFEPNVGPAYVPFHITNRDGCLVPAKYVRVKMTNDPYMYGMLNSTGEVFKGMIHAAPVLDITNVPCLTVEDLTTLRFDFPDATRINNALARVGDRSLVAEVHRFRHIKQRFAELAEQMKTLEEEMWMLQTKQRQCVGCLEKADVLRRINDERGQDIRVVPSWVWEDDDE